MTKKEIEEKLEGINTEELPGEAIKFYYADHMWIWPIIRDPNDPKIFTLDHDMISSEGDAGLVLAQRDIVDILDEDIYFRNNDPESEELYEEIPYEIVNHLRHKP